MLLAGNLLGQHGTLPFMGGGYLDLPPGRRVLVRVLYLDYLARLEEVRDNG